MLCICTVVRMLHQYEPLAIVYIALVVVVYCDDNVYVIVMVIN